MLFNKIAPLFLLAFGACTASPQSAPKNEGSPVPAEAPAVLATAAAPAASGTAEMAQGAPAALTPIADPSTVCMVNDQHMSVTQIPVQVDGKTYYGCCQMCEAKLKNNEQVRFGRDPVTQKPVDKATAVLAMDAKGKVLYFESEANMQAFALRK